ncbi:MAG: ABC transporter ATP-binding protein, partial [Scytonema sp. PMC 1069.18]|nr:ABC transporter ATP-binding protein [Scytonema sp. PMC 1069.18]MEC4888366.1 ABC transporter ATP-binding protein [Scytonema sp. PMC 1070.18]
MTLPTILRLENVTLKYSQMRVPSVCGVSLELAQGDVLGLVGPSGCGKTTLLRIIAGFESPQVGTVEIAEKLVAGNDNWIPPEQRYVGMVFQDYALFPHLSVVENIAFGLRFATAKDRRIQVAELLELVRLTGLDNRYPHELSGGQQQRVALARALATQPQLLLLDEPLSNLDVQVRLRLREEVLAILKAKKISGIFVTHDQQEALAIADQVAVMQQGKLEQIGTPEEIYTQPASRFVAEFITQANFLPARRKGDIWETEIGYFTPTPPHPYT